MDIKNGIVCFTFDDRNFKGWLDAMPIFERYNAHASFFISGEIDDEAVDAAKKLYEAGHTVGLHTKNHADAPEYFEKNGAEMYYENEIVHQKRKLEENGIRVTSFAYPNNRRTDETDRFLGRYFEHFRAGKSKSDEKYVPIANLLEKKLMRGAGIGDYYNTTEEGVLEKIRFASKENVCMTFFSHNIKEDADYIDMPRELLCKCLELAQKENVKVLGFDDLSEIINSVQ